MSSEVALAVSRVTFHKARIETPASLLLQPSANPTQSQSHAYLAFFAPQSNACGVDLVRMRKILRELER